MKMRMRCAELWSFGPGRLNKADLLAVQNKPARKRTRIEPPLTRPAEEEDEEEEESDYEERSPPTFYGALGICSRGIVEPFADLTLLHIFQLPHSRATATQTTRMSSIRTIRTDPARRETATSEQEPRNCT